MARKHSDVPLVIDFHTHMLDAELVRLNAVTLSNADLRMVAGGIAARLLGIDAAQKSQASRLA